MYSAKDRGRMRYELFDPSMRARIADRLNLESDLRQAIERDELVIHYQPIISLDLGKLSGFEALLRWNHPAKGLLYPNDFMAIAEESSLITLLDRWIILRACKQMKEWQERNPYNPPISISINISGKQISRPDFVDFISQVLAETRLAARCLKLEITENTIMENNEIALNIFQKLQSLDVQIQIDDFGIGYSSLGYLSQLPINALKIDKSFIHLM